MMVVQQQLKSFTLCNEWWLWDKKTKQLELFRGNNVRIEGYTNYYVAVIRCERGLKALGMYNEFL